MGSSALTHGLHSRAIVRAEHLGDFRVDEEFEIRAQRSLHTAKLFGRLTEKAITKGNDQFMRTLVGLVHKSFDGRVRIHLIEQKPVDVGNRDISLHMPEDFKPGLNRDLRLGREERFCPRPPVSETAVSTMTWHTWMRERSGFP
jgi:hypothetical protein